MVAPMDVGYDEFAMLGDNAAEAGLPFDVEQPPEVRRTAVVAPSGRTLSALVWGAGEPELVFLHGGAQNAHTWDTVALALGRSLVAIDLPGHGHSDWRPARDYAPHLLADDVAHAIGSLAPAASTLIGMSLGGLTAVAPPAAPPPLARRIAVLAVTPRVQASGLCRREVMGQRPRGPR